VIGQRQVVRLAVGDRHELLRSFSASRRVDVVAVVDARQRADAVPAVLGADRVDERELHVGPVPHLLGDEVEILLVVTLVEDDVAVLVLRTQHAVVELEGAVLADELRWLESKLPNSCARARFSTV
jgi:hypothetical protein